MAMTCYSTWGVLPSYPSSKSCSNSQKMTPFLGFSMAAVSSKPTFCLIKTDSNKKRSTQIRCQDVAVEEAATALIPREQQWMFDATDFKGPVYLSLPPSLPLYMPVLFNADSYPSFENYSF